MAVIERWPSQPVTIMSTNPDRANKSDGPHRKGGNNRKSKKNGGNNASKNDRGTRPLEQARFIIVSSLQYAAMFIQQMMTLPTKVGQRMSAFTVDDIIEQMCTLHVFKVDPDLAIDTFRELKEAKVTDAYGRRFDFEAFRRLLSWHPALSHVRLSHDKKLTNAVYSKHTAPVVKKAAQAAFDEGKAAYQTAFLAHIKKNGLSLETLNSMSESVRAAVMNTFNPDYTADGQFAIWLREDVILSSGAVRKGSVVSKTKFRTAFEKTYRLEGKEAPSKAYRLKGTVKVYPQRELVIDGASSRAKTVGEGVSLSIDWAVVLVPKWGPGEFYLNRVIRVGNSTLNPAEGHVALDMAVKNRWDSMGTSRLGWRPHPALRHAYGTDVAEVLDGVDNIDDLLNGLSDGRRLVVERGQWMVIDEAPKARQKTKKAKSPNAHRGKAGKWTGPDDDEEDDAQPITVG